MFSISSFMHMKTVPCKLKKSTEMSKINISTFICTASWVKCLVIVTLWCVLKGVQVGSDYTTWAIDLHDLHPSKSNFLATPHPKVPLANASSLPLYPNHIPGIPSNYPSHDHNSVLQGSQIWYHDHVHSTGTVTSFVSGKTTHTNCTVRPCFKGTNTSASV